ncbi:DinB family protein [Kribbella sp. NPDC056951]|uniref:DinB family protein n=1 Tax=Kribbella sp. NPDC056951 TaxID=3345978 RepID=UPI00364015B1
MDVDWCDEVVDQLESHWQGQLRPRLDGLTDDEYFWEPVPNCWTLSRRGKSTAPISFGAGEFTLDYAQPQPDPEPVTTIAWRMAHLSVVFASTGGLGRAPVDEWTYPYAGTAREALSQLDHEYERWIADVRGLGTEGLSRPQGAPPAFAHAPMAKKMLFTNVEVIHHGAEICLLRDLYLQKM